MPPKKNRTYGTKKSAATASATRIFGTATSSTTPPKPQIIDNITEQLSRYNISEEEEPAFDLSVLAPIIDGLGCNVVDWDEILPVKCTVAKIAEASFSEVYRITTINATSIIKILPLNVSHDPESAERSYAQKVEDVVSELRIMDSLTEIPGFVTFKGAHLAIGAPSEKFVKAWVKYHKTNEESEFNNPSDYGKQATFLVIELGDAGKVLDEFPVYTASRVWDIFLGAVLALSRAETLYKFEHRDLHENNICAILHPVSPKIARRHKQLNPSLTSPQPVFGRSGVEITIIDYGLSRAEMGSRDIAFKDLEEDLEIFQGTDGHAQYDAYRRMRNHLFTGGINYEKSSWHTEASKGMSNGRTWKKYTPYSNVIWLGYLFKYLSGQYREKKNQSEAIEAYEEFVKRSANTRARFEHTNRKRPKDGPFVSANDVLDWVVAEDLMTVNQIEEFAADSFFK